MNSLLYKKLKDLEKKYGMVTAIIWFKYMAGDFIFLGQGMNKEERVWWSFGCNVLESQCYFVLLLLAKGLFLFKRQSCEPRSKG